MKIPTLLRGPICLFLLLSLTACGAGTRVTTKTEIVEVPVYRAIDPRLTTAPSEPPLLPADARNRDLAEAEAELRAWGRQMASMLAEIAALQAKD